MAKAKEIKEAAPPSVADLLQLEEEREEEKPKSPTEIKIGVNTDLKETVSEIRQAKGIRAKWVMRGLDADLVNTIIKGII